MPLVNPVGLGNVFQHEVHGNILGRPTMLVTRWVCVGVPASVAYPSAILDVNTALGAAIMAALRPCLPSNWSSEFTKSQRIAESPTVWPPMRSRANRINITLAGTWPAVVSNQPATAGALQRYSYNSGKTEQGELHVGPLADNTVVNGELTAGIQVALGGLATVLTSNVAFGAGGVLSPVFFRTGTKAAPHQPSVTLCIGSSIGLNYSSEKRRRGVPFGV